MPILSSSSSENKISRANPHLLERSLQKTALSLGNGWDLELMETIIDNYEVDFRNQSDQTLSKIETALREILGRAADLFIDRFYLDLRKTGYFSLL